VLVRVGGDGRRQAAERHLQLGVTFSWASPSVGRHLQLGVTVNPVDRGGLTVGRNACMRDETRDGTCWRACLNVLACVTERADVRDGTSLMVLLWRA